MLLLCLRLLLAPPALAGPVSTPVVAPASEGVIWIRVLNAKDVAAQERGAWLVGVLGRVADVDHLAQDAIVEGLRAQLAEQGVVATVDRVELLLPASRWLHRDLASGEERLIDVPAGEARLIRVEVLNAEDLVVREKGATVTRLARALGVDLRSKVNARVVDQVFQGMAEAGVMVAIRVE